MHDNQYIIDYIFLKAYSTFIKYFFSRFLKEEIPINQGIK